MHRKQESAPLEGSSSHKLILIIDGDAKGGTLLAQIVRKATPYSAYAVHNGHQALKLVQEVRPDLILLGAGLPDMKSVEVSKQLHHIRKLEDVPVLFLDQRLDSPKPEAQEPPPMETVRFPTLTRLIQIIQKELA